MVHRGRPLEAAHVTRGPFTRRRDVRRRTVTAAQTRCPAVVPRRSPPLPRGTTACRMSSPPGDRRLLGRHRNANAFWSERVGDRANRHIPPVPGPPPPVPLLGPDRIEIGRATCRECV